MSSPIERIRVKLPEAFDARKHTGAILTKVAQAHGEGWEIESIDTTARTLTAIRQAQITQVSASTDTPEAMVLGLARGTKPSDGDRIAARFEDAHPGYSLTRFDPYLGQATMTRLSEAEVRARGAVAVALGAKVWDVQVSARTGGGFHLSLPSSFVPSKHLGKLTEVAEHVVGRPGWFVQANAAELTAHIVPASPPTFPGMIATPMKALSKDRDRTAFGMQLPPPGKTAGEVLTIDWTAQSFALLAGTPGSGKTVAANALIAGAVASGNDLVIVDEFSKRVDFLWAREFTRDGGWGCDSLPAAVTSLAMVYEEGQRRAGVLAEKGHVNWLDMPASEQFRPVLIVVELRNALAHGQSHNDQRLAEPTATAVAEMRRVRDLLLKPPTVIAVLKPGKPFVAGPQESVRDVLERMYANDFSQVPVYDGNDYVGLLTTNTVARWVAVQMTRNDGLAEDTSIEEALTFGEGPENVRHLRKQTSAPEAVRLFVGAAERGEPLAALILTESGKKTQTPVAMVVPADLPRLVDAAT